MKLIKNIFGACWAIWGIVVFTSTLLIIIIPVVFTFGVKDPKGAEMFRKISKAWMNVFLLLIGSPLKVRGKKYFEKGKNYGWPVISYGINYDGKILTPYTSKDGMEQPLVKWIPSIAPSGLTVVTGDKYPAWKGDILMGSLRFKYLNRVHLNGNVPGDQEALLKNVGRVRFVTIGPDGYVYVGVEEPGYIFRLLPVETLKK